MSKYFKKVQSLEDLKNKFKVLARKHHPDAGGNVAVMQEINNEYEALFYIWKNKHERETGQKVEETAGSTAKKFYTENGWEGSRYNGKMTTTDIAKAIRVYCKEKYPTWKFSVTAKYFSGGSSINVTLMEAPVDIFDREYFKLPRSNYYHWTVGERRDCWDFDKMTDQGEYHMQLHNIGDRENEPWFNDVGYEVCKDVYDFMQSYNYDDSDSMIDYFDKNFYGSFNIGKWNKGLKIVPKTTRIANKKANTRLGFNRS